MALRDFEEAQDYIAQDNPFAAQAVAQRIADASRRLIEYPEIGRPGHVPGSREWVVSRTPYLLVYRINTAQQTLEILRVWHSSRDWQNLPIA